MPYIHFIGGEKGGVGKSVMSRLLAQYHIDNHIPFAGFDTDRSHSTFSRFYGEFSAPVVVDKFESLDSILEYAEENPNKALLVDLAAQTFPYLYRWSDECSLFELLDELGYEAMFWHVMDDGKDSINLLQKLLQHYGDDAQCTLVKNFGRGSDFSDMEQSPAFINACKMNAHVISLNRLHEAAMHKIEMNDLSFWAAANVKGLLKMPDRMRVKVWLNRAYEQIRSVHGMHQTQLAPLPA